MTTLETPSPVACYRCGVPILPGQGRYNVFPRESYCSWDCLRESAPHIAETITLFVREPIDVRSSRPATPC